MMVRTLRGELGLAQFEMAQIANLCLATPQELKNVVPMRVLARVLSLPHFWRHIVICTCYSGWYDCRISLLHNGR